MNIFFGTPGTFNIYSMFSYVFIICLKCYILYLLSYPKSRDAIASKNEYSWILMHLNLSVLCFFFMKMNLGHVYVCHINKSLGIDDKTNWKIWASWVDRINASNTRFNMQDRTRPNNFYHIHSPNLIFVPPIKILFNKSQCFIFHTKFHSGWCHETIGQ